MNGSYGAQWNPTGPTAKKENDQKINSATPITNNPWCPPKLRTSNSDVNQESRVRTAIKFFVDPIESTRGSIEFHRAPCIPRRDQDSWISLIPWNEWILWNAVEFHGPTQSPPKLRTSNSDGKQEFQSNGPAFRKCRIGMPLMVCNGPGFRPCRAKKSTKTQSNGPH